VFIESERSGDVGEALAVLPETRAVFDADGDGSLEIKSPDKEKVTIEKSGGSFSVTVDEP
jgi:hypothetical protein